MTVPNDNIQQRSLPTLLRAVILACAYWFLSLSLTVTAGSIAAIAGCIFACFFIDLNIRKDPLDKLRTTAILLFSLSLFLAAILVASLVVSTNLISTLFSPIAGFELGEVLKWFGISLSLTLSLRTLSHRTSFGSILEILFVAIAFVVTLSAHRNGMIHRPFFIGDFALIRGIDPSTILLSFGCAAVLSLAALLMIENNQRRLPYHFTALGLICFSLVIFVQMFGLPTPSMTDDLGLTGQEQNGNGSQRENPFRDGENDANDMEAPVAVVVFRDDYEPLNGAYYFRESAYSQYRGTMLDVTSRDDMDRDLIDHFTSNRSDSGLLPGATDERIPVRTSIGMLVSHRIPFGLESPIGFENTPNPNNLRFKRTYDAYSLAPTYDFDYLLGRELGRDDWSDEVWEEYLQLPDDPRYKELAESIIGNLKTEYTDDAFAKAWSIKTYLDENGIYSLKNQHAYETDPAASFLFGDLTGYCMHFAFSATYMFRSLGIPARVGIGYSVPAANRAGGSSLLVQAIHGHAWPEIYFKDIGWVIVDPAPQQTLVDMTTDPQDTLQQLLGDMLRNDASFEDFLQSEQSSLISLERLLTVFYILVLSAIVTAYLIKIYRLWIPSRAALKSQYRLSYRSALDQLSAIGIYRKTGESREQFAARASTIAPTMKKLTRQHLSMTLGSEDRTSCQRVEWLALNECVNQEIRENADSWKVYLAILNPFSWVLSR
jgi:transglutaminase-like putative cysteine protease